MDNQLKEFTRANIDLQGTRDGFTPIKERWYSWNYWAQQQTRWSFLTWMTDNNLEFSDIRAKAFYPNAEVIYDRTQGYNYYSAWRGAQLAVEHAEEEFDLIFKELWEARTPSGQPAYTNEQLGEAIGKDAEQLRKFAQKRAWYKPRTKGTK